MVLLKTEVKTEIVRQIEKGTSIKKISKSLGLGKSTIYYYYKKIKGKRYKEPSFELNASETEGEIVGIFTGDGSQFFEPKKYSYEVNVHFGGKNEWYALYVKQLFESYFQQKFWLTYNKVGTIRLQTKSKKIFNYFKNYIDYDSHIKHSTVELKSLNLPKEFKIGFLRGLIDTDGCIAYLKIEKRTRITFCTTSRELSIQICNILTEFEINNSSYVQERKYRNEKPVYYVIIHKNSTDRFINIIKPLKTRTEKGW